MRAKLKSHSGAKKRLIRTGTGKLKRKKCGARHLATGKGQRRHRRLKAPGLVYSGLQPRLDRLLPN